MNNLTTITSRFDSIREEFFVNPRREKLANLKRRILDSCGGVMAGSEDSGQARIKGKGNRKSTRWSGYSKPDMRNDFTRVGERGRGN